MLPIENLCTIHTVDWELSAKHLKQEYVNEVAQNYQVFGNNVPEPTFAITDLRINASQIKGYGENNGFIRFVYNGIPFIKKYCPRDDFAKMTRPSKYIVGENKKNLSLNLICQFVLNKWEDTVSPQVKILYFDSIEAEKVGDIEDANEFKFEKPVKNENKMIKTEKVEKMIETEKVEEETKKPKKKMAFDDIDFDW